VCRRDIDSHGRRGSDHGVPKTFRGRAAVWRYLVARRIWLPMGGIDQCEIVERRGMGKGRERYGVGVAEGGTCVTRASDAQTLMWRLFQAVAPIRTENAMTLPSTIWKRLCRGEPCERSRYSTITQLNYGMPLAEPCAVSGDPTARLMTLPAG
jgi:hypothetical protein